MVYELGETNLQKIKLYSNHNKSLFPTLYNMCISLHFVLFFPYSLIHR